MDRNTPSRKPGEFEVTMAVVTLDSHLSPSPLDDPDMRHVDPSPGSLDLVPPGVPDNGHAAESGAARGEAKWRFLRRG